VIQWQLGKSIGDTLYYFDDYGNEFGIILYAGLENSIFQGNLLISEENFLKRFPSVNGSTIFITESSLSEMSTLIEELNFSLQDYGLNLSTTFERLAEFNKIENTYLSIFLILGSFGILIGSIGIGLVVTRNVQEQRKELALLQALGFTKNRILHIINSSYLILLIYGIILGLIAAFTASLPTLIGTNSEVPYFLIIVISILIIISGFVSIFLTTKLSLKGNVNDLLRND
ncbi:MAG: FtsX-like permease family protein, partial [Melioribacteraceae bacterium]|nr:FtsX-like permease family protein [Melioribacteraceae bacterium]